VISEGSSSGPFQVIFWLQETEPEKNALATLVPGGTIFRYQGPAISSVQLSSPANTGSFALDESNAGLFFKYASSPQAGTARWTFANGDPLMSIDASNNRKTVYFNSRFNPQWTDLVWKESFARMLIPIVLPSFKQNDTDLRQVSFSQAQVNPARGKVNGHVNEPGFMNSIDLSFAGWILIFLVFTAERILSHRQTKQKNA
jgi:hypothetical protein